MKTLIATLIAAAALVGTQVSAYYHEYTLSQMKDDERIDTTDGGVLVNIDAQRTLKFIDTNPAPSLTLDFQGSFILKAYFMIEMPYDGFLNITSTEDAVKTAWKTAFSVEDGDSITLCTAGDYIGYKHGPLQLFGRDAGSTVLLDGTEVVYKGAVDGLELLQQNEVGIVWGTKDIKLVGKIDAEPGPTPPVPEPTTGSLSLLALAGLCIRRRK